MIPSCMRTEILKKLHDGHQGITKCIGQKSEPLLPTEFPERPWQVWARGEGADLLKCKGHWYLIRADYFSRYIEIAKFDVISVRTIIKKPNQYLLDMKSLMLCCPTVEHNSIAHHSYN
ncbi:hypothetical protein PR048_020788 [Dryococelus australis]|uniref:Uncharacterized protein n=1 Tax=Dryococelus australis TaxID=614101 RepID=A0ABQ9GWD4_9NEOP|nr:hypothetical protein PR048_020788 [Dryococelus australis]